MTKSFDLRHRPFSSGSEQDGDAVGPLRPLRRRLRDAVVNGAQVLIDLDRLEAGGVGILQVLNDPHPAAVVEGDRHRLADHRLGGDDLDLEAVGDLHASTASSGDSVWPIANGAGSSRAARSATRRHAVMAGASAEGGRDEGMVMGRRALGKREAATVGVVPRGTGFPLPPPGRRRSILRGVLRSNAVALAPGGWRGSAANSRGERACREGKRGTLQRMPILAQLG